MKDQAQFLLRPVFCLCVIRFSKDPPFWSQFWDEAQVEICTIELTMEHAEERMYRKDSELLQFETFVLEAVFSEAGASGYPHHSAAREAREGD